MNECAYESCARPVHGRGLCVGHAWQERQGKPLAPLRAKRTKTDDAETTFWDRVDQSGNCWLWTGARSDGYGAVHWEGRKRGAHVVAYELANGPLTDGLVPDHRCRNRACVNPDHLRPATAKQNAENRCPQSNNKSGYRGVRRDRRGKRWIAAARNHGVEHRVPGSFATAEEAHAAAVELRSRLFTHSEEFADALVELVSHGHVAPTPRRRVNSVREAGVAASPHHRTPRLHRVPGLLHRMPGLMCHTTHDTTGRTITFHDHTGRAGVITVPTIIPAGVFKRILNVIEVFEDTDHPDTIETLEGA